MRIAIDAQILQSPRLCAERFERACGWVAELLGETTGRDVFILLDGALETRIPAIRARFGGLTARGRIRCWYPVRSAAASQAIREAALASLDPDIVVVLTAGGFRSESESSLHRFRRVVLACADSDETPAQVLGRVDTPELAADRPAVRPRLAYVSPLPPERSGISYYSAELVEALGAHFDIDLVVDQKTVSEGGFRSGLAVRSYRWFAANAGHYHHVLYHFGNSNFHRKMFALLKAHPGVVVLHDVFLSGVVSEMDTSGRVPGFWFDELYRSHGYRAASERFLEKVPVDVIWRYPCSGGVIEDATGVIVHSPSSRALIDRWYGAEAARKVSVVPHLRAPSVVPDRATARRSLRIADGDFLVCAFGGLGPTKLNHRLIDAWTASKLARDRSSRLVFVGTNEGGFYGRGLTAAIERAGAGGRIAITGWADEALFRTYLAASDAAVQLRTLSRGESSGTVLDCLNAGRPLVVNDHGSMADLPADAAIHLADDFADADLVAALERLRIDLGLREALAASGLAYLRASHDPQAVALNYRDAIETFAARPRTSLARLHRLLAGEARGDVAARDAMAASAILSMEPPTAKRQLFVDVTAIARDDLRTGIERAARALLQQLIAHPPEGFRVEPVYASGLGFRYARTFTVAFLGVRSKVLRDAPIEPRSGDIYFMPDLHHQSVIRNRATYRALRNHGVSVNFMVHDLLPVRLPQFFPSHAAVTHAAWLDVVAEADRAICVSQSVADDLETWLDERGTSASERPAISHSHHGADLARSGPTTGLPADAAAVLRRIRSACSFLMVGTVEPRKGHAQVLDGFERLWAAGRPERLVIAGRAGWQVDDLVARLRGHAERGRRLDWIEGASDEYLDLLYASSTCLVAASLGEGFGLPLIEAAIYDLPILARDIPVFREVAGASATFFAGETPEDAERAIANWTELHASGQAPRSHAIGHLTWEESAEALKRILLG